MVFIGEIYWETFGKKWVKNREIFGKNWQKFRTLIFVK